MTVRTLTQLLMLLAAMQAVSAFKFRCLWFCTDQTGIQSDYIEARDDCRAYAQLRLDTDTANPAVDEKNRTGKLISLFSSCMADKGWTVPDGKTGQASANVPVAANAAQIVPPAAPPSQPVKPAPVYNPNAPAITTAENAAALEAKKREKKALARATECAFARHGADFSSVSAARAKACDLECEMRMEAQPNGPKPAACP